jgi:hypothetical protein
LNLPLPLPLAPMLLLPPLSTVYRNARAGTMRARPTRFAGLILALDAPRRISYIGGIASSEVSLY